MIRLFERAAVKDFVLMREALMPNEKQCNIARQITQSNTPDIDVNIQYSTIRSSDKLLLCLEIDKLLKRYDIPVEGGWYVHKSELDNIAQEHLVSSATAYCIYKEWMKSMHESI